MVDFWLHIGHEEGQSLVFVWKVHPPRPPPYADFVTLSTTLLTSAFAHIIITMATRGRCLTIKVDIGHEKLLCGQSQTLSSATPTISDIRKGVDRHHVWSVLTILNWLTCKSVCEQWTLTCSLHLVTKTQTSPVPQQFDLLLEPEQPSTRNWRLFPLPVEQWPNVPYHPTNSPS